MTLVVALTTQHTIWLLTDRRLSRGTKVVTDDACKCMALESTDGQALLGYAGVGATARGTQPSDWMSKVLRGRNWPLEHSLGAIAHAMQREFPPHLRTVPKGVPAAHFILVPAFVGSDVRLYSMRLELMPDRKSRVFRFNREQTRSGGPPRFAIAGSGAAFLPSAMQWSRRILRLAKAHDKGQVSANVVAEEFAALNSAVHAKDALVGPKCLVFWRYSNEGTHGGGGGHRFYDGTSFVEDGCSVPQLARGMDVNALLKAMMPSVLDQFAALREGRTPEDDRDRINQAIRKMPWHPDEKLR